MRRPQVYDKAKWHHEGTYPQELPIEQVFVYTGLFLGWLVEQRLTSEEFEEDFGADLQRVRSGDLSGPAIYHIIDGAFVEDMLSVDGNTFTQAYYVPPEGYPADFAALLCSGLPTAYHVLDTRENYQRLKATIDQRFEAWRQATGQE